MEVEQAGDGVAFADGRTFRIFEWGVIKPENASFNTLPSSLHPSSSSAAVSFLMPHGFKSGFWYHHQRVPGKSRGVAVEYVSQVKLATGGHGSAASFQVLLASAAVVVAVASTPAAAWEAVIRPPPAAVASSSSSSSSSSSVRKSSGGGGGRKLDNHADDNHADFDNHADALLCPGVRLVMRRLVRCRALLNWVAYREFAFEAFWAPVDRKAYPDYRSYVQRPMHLALVQVSSRPKGKRLLLIEH